MSTEEEHHNDIWWFFHKLGIAHIKHENAHWIRVHYKQCEILDPNGEIVDFDKMTDDEAIAFNRKVLRQKMRSDHGDPSAAAAAGSIPSAPSGWSRPLNELGNELG